MFGMQFANNPKAMVKLFWEMHVSPGFFLCAEAASTSSGCRWQKAPRSWRESAPTRWSRTAAGTKTNTSATNCGSDLTEPRLLQTSPCEGLFQGRLQSHTGAPPTSGPQPPAVLAWSSQPGCVRSGRLSWPSLSDPYTPQGTSSNTAPPAGSWNTAHGQIINQKHPPEYKHNRCTSCRWCGHSSDRPDMPGIFDSCLSQSQITALLQLNELWSLCTIWVKPHRQDAKMKILSAPANQVTVINKLIILTSAPGEEVKIIWSVIIKSSWLLFPDDASLDICPKTLPVVSWNPIIPISNHPYITRIKRLKVDQMSNKHVQVRSEIPSQSFEPSARWRTRRSAHGWSGTESAQPRRDRRAAGRKA